MNIRTNEITATGHAWHPIFRRWYWLCLALLLLTLNACTTTPMANLPDDGLAAPAADVDQGIPEQAPNYVYDSSSDTSQRSDSGQPSHTQARRPPSGTVVALLNQAHEQQRAGNLERAAAVLERALRLDPKNGHLWHELAQIRLQQGLFDQATSLAAKSSSLAQDDDNLVSSNNELIEQVKTLRGEAH